MILLVSACLAGFHCRYDGAGQPDEQVIALVREGKAIPVWPELMGGLPAPRQPVELTADGKAVLLGKGRALAKDGTDVTEAFLRGAKETLRIARLYGAERAVFKAFSPSCGAGAIYDGSFTGTKKQGDGVTTALLKINGIPVEIK